MRAVAAILLILSLHAYAGEVLSESSKDLGFGFRHVRRSEAVTASFESVGHFSYFFYRDKNLSQTSIYSVAPSGRYALFQDGPSGKVMLFKPADGRVIEVLPQFVALVRDFMWNESANVAYIMLEGSQPRVEVSLE